MYKNKIIYNHYIINLDLSEDTENQVFVNQFYITNFIQIHDTYDEMSLDISLTGATV